MKIIDISNNIITIISFIVNLFFLIPFLYKIYKYFTQNRYIKRVLGYNKEPVQIYQSTFAYNTVEGCVNDFVTYNSLEGIHNIINIFNLRNQKFAFANQIDGARNEICIGGFLNNKRVNAYFNKYFKNFRYYVNANHMDKYEKFLVDNEMIAYTDNKTGFKINDDIFLETSIHKNDYAFLIKLTDSDFEGECKKTVHILFGGRAIGTLKATEYFATQYKEIYKKYKSNHYFLAVEISLIDNSLNLKTGMIDLTDKMFS